MKPVDYLQARPTADHPKRCKGKSRGTGERCWNWAAKGREYCAFHGGRGKTRGRQISVIQGVDVRYAKHLSKRLSDRAAELTAEGSPIQDLSDEITLVRTLVGDALDVYSSVEKMPDGDRKTRAFVEAGMIVRDCVQEVADLVVKLSRVQEAAKAKVDLVVFHNVVAQVSSQITRLLRDFCDENNLDSGPLLLAVAESIREVRLPDDASAGTTILPDQDVLEMDTTVPRVVPRTQDGVNGHVA